MVAIGSTQTQPDATSIEDGGSIEEIHWSEAEALMELRLDRRRTYGATVSRTPISEGIGSGYIVFELCKFLISCPGCHETIDGYPVWPEVRDKNGIALGGGCAECGYTGKRREIIWLPVIELDL